MALECLGTDDRTSTSITARIRQLQRSLSRDVAEGVDVLGLRQHVGQRGCVTEHRGEGEGCGHARTDDDGSIVLSGGLSPAKLAVGFAETTRHHVGLGRRTGCCTVALRHIEGAGGHDEEEDIFLFPLPVAMCSETGAVPIPAPTSERVEYHDGLMAVALLPLHWNGLFRVLMDMARRYLAVLGKGKSAELLEQLGGPDLVLSIMDHESDREQRLSEHVLVERIANHRAEMFGTPIGIVEPDPMVTHWCGSWSRSTSSPNANPRLAPTSPEHPPTFIR